MTTLNMGIGRFFFPSALLVLWVGCVSSAVQANERAFFTLGLGVDCDSSQSESLQFKAYLPDIVQFLIGSRTKDVRVISAEYGNTRRPASDGTVVMSSAAFRLVAYLNVEQEYMPTSFEGGGEVVSGKDFCQEVGDGISIDLGIAGERVATIKLIHSYPEENDDYVYQDGQRIGVSEEVIRQTEDLIGLRFFEDLEYLLSTEFKWVSGSWHPSNVNPYQPTDFYNTTERHEKECKAEGKSFNEIVRSGPYCDYIEKTEAVENLLSIVRGTELRDYTFPKTSSGFQLSALPIDISAHDLAAKSAEYYCFRCALLIRSEAGDLGVALIEERGRLVLSQSHEEIGLPERQVNDDQ